MASEIKVVAIYAPADEPLWQALKIFIWHLQAIGSNNIKGLLCIQNKRDTQVEQPHLFVTE
jgi:hypothetical protein